MDKNAIKKYAADERVQELLKKIQGLNNKIAEVTGNVSQEKLAEYGIGLNEVKSYEVDMDFFNSLNDD